MWTVLTGEHALGLRTELIAAAEAGDFSEFTGENGVRASIVIQGSDDPMDEAGSPLARHLAGGSSCDDARAYELILPEVERVLTRTDDYEFLWRDVWQRIADALESFERGSSKVTEYEDAKLSVITLSPELLTSPNFKATKHGAPYTAISQHARGELYLIARPLAGGWSYRLDYPYYSWAETAVRPPIARRDLGALVARLNELEKSSGGEWLVDRSELASAAKFAGQDKTPALSGLAPEIVAEETRTALLQETEKAFAGA